MFSKLSRLNLIINVLPVNQNFNDHGYGRNIYIVNLVYQLVLITMYYKFSIGIEKKYLVCTLHIVQWINWSIRLIHKRVYVLYYMYCLQDFFLSFKICTSHHNILCIFLFKDYALESIVSFPISVASFSIWYSFNFISIFI